jgi:RNA-directed DNA polymerase
MEGKPPDVAPGRRTKICILSLYRYPLYNPACISPFGGSEVRVSLIARELAKYPDLDINVVMFDHGQPPIEMREGLVQFGLELHPEKTRLIEFGRNAVQNREKRGEGKRETFDFLGFTHMCGKSGKTGYFVVKRKTVKRRMRAKLQALKEELRRRMHELPAETWEWLQTVVRGYFQYHAIPGNTGSLGRFRERLTRLWWQNIRRRSQKRRPNWNQLHPLFIRWLPVPHILHHFPSVRFDLRYPS